MREAGLSEVGIVADESGEVRNLVGLLPGSTPREIILSAHFDSVADSPGAGDDASGCGVVIAAAADLTRTPLAHGVRVVLFDREEDRLAGSRSWLSTLEPGERDRILADLNVEMVGWGGSAGAVVHLFGVERRGSRVVPPAWLAHAVLEAGRAIGWPLSAADPRISVLGQLVVRTTELRHYADSDALLAEGIPAILLSDSSLTAFDPAYHTPADGRDRLDRQRLERWTDLVAASVRRLDGLKGRPRDDDRYLVVGGRVLHRRVLYWIGFAVWVALVFRGLPGRWRRRAGGERRRAGRRYLPGYVTRMLFLVSLLVAPVLSVALLLPAALAALGRWRSARARWMAQSVTLLPVFLYLLVLGVATGRGFVRSVEIGALSLALVASSLAAFSWALWHRPE